MQTNQRQRVNCNQSKPKPTQRYAKNRQSAEQREPVQYGNPTVTATGNAKVDKRNKITNAVNRMAVNAKTASHNVRSAQTAQVATNNGRQNESRCSKKNQNGNSNSSAER